MSEETDNGQAPEEFEEEHPNPNGLRAFEALGAFLEEDGWHPQRIDDKHVFHTFFMGKHGELHCYAQVRVDLEQFIFYTVAPVKVPEELRLSVAEFITRANYGLRIGNFEMDFADGEVRYKSSIDFEGVELSFGLLQHAIYPAVQTMDHYLPGLLRVIYGGQTPYEAIAEVEGP